MSSEPIRIGLSPCPNDTFIFDAMLHHKVDTEGLAFEPCIADVEELNRRAFAGDTDMTKISFHALMSVSGNYNLLTSGSALGRGCGPLLIAREMIPEHEISGSTVAIPGRHTTANFLFSLAFPAAIFRTEVLFSEIEDRILKDEFRCGLIIHENRFTYREKGLVCMLDLGEYWESLTGLPIPLGGIAVKNSLPLPLQRSMNRIMKRSVDFALGHPHSSEAFVIQHAQAMNPEVRRAHISLYVNEFTSELGREGKKAVTALFSKAISAGIIPAGSQAIFVE